MGFPGGSMVKNPPASAVDARDVGSIPGEGRCPEGGNGNPLQYSCLEIPWTEEPDRLEFIGLQRAGHNLATKQQKQVIKQFSPVQFSHSAVSDSL